MNLFKSLLSSFTKAQTITPVMRRFANSINSTIYNVTYPNYSSSPVYDNQNPQQVMEETFLSNPDVFAVIDGIYSMAKQAKLRLIKVEEDGTKEVVQYDPKYSRFIKQVAKQYTFDEFLQYYFYYYLTIGNSFWNIVRFENGALKGQTAELVPMFSPWVDVVTSDNPVYPVSGYQYSWNPNSSTVLDTEDVVHIKYANPKYVYGGQFYGLSPMRIALDVVRKQNNIIQAEKAQIGRGGPQKAAFKVSKNEVESFSTEEQQDDFKGSMQDYIKEQRGDTPLLPFEIGVVDLESNTSDMGLIESASDGLKTIARMYHFPVELVGVSSATYNNMNEAKKSAWTNCIMPFLDTFQEAFTKAIITPEDIEQGWRFEFNYADVDELQDDKSTLITTMKAAFATPNELRKIMGLEPLDGDEFNEPWVEFNINPASDKNNFEGGPTEIPA